jgi:molybdate transport system regulatory protein
MTRACQTSYPCVILCADIEGMRHSARNRLCGTVSRIQTRAVNAEVKLDLSAGRTLTPISGPEE